MPILSWLTREQDLKAADRVPYKLLERDDALSHGDPGDGSYGGNMLIQGDNLEALKALLPYYRGQVKCIYIDPPFGTGKEFENYDDSWKHALWLQMMFPRIELLRDLLKDDGALFVHLDDNELDYAKVILDEIFGRDNFVSRISIKARSPSAFSTVNPGVFKASEYLLWYAKDKPKMPQRRVWTAREPDTAYKKWINNPDDDPREWNIESATKRINQYLKEDAGRLSPSNALKKFYVDNAKHLMRLAEISDSGAGEDIVNLKYKSLERKGQVLKMARVNHDDVIVLDGQQVLTYDKNIHEIDGVQTPARMLTNIWDDISWEGIAGEGGVRLKKGKKPEKLIRRCLQLITVPGDLVLDSFLGSGTTAAVAMKMRRRLIGIERGQQAETHCHKRLVKVCQNDASGISKLEGWKGGGEFAFYRLGCEVFTPDGSISPGIKFAPLAAHVWFAETGAPLAKEAASPFLGVHEGKGIALLYNGILGDKSVSGGNVLTRKTLSAIRQAAGGFEGPLIVYGEASRLGEEARKREGITFRQTPYDVKAR
ncbi:site-specific DNA-methyltransferase [Paraurantiacibacter namhicola]|uniref:site-specific DNA-methyltransferase (adenine-specific) n=1 Tax=Paraurantiacibacter namhicola TaxID=645517 RepID=A0A1C7DBE1_9SPHN|nr:site-specific DNA-methyltransferase [Paraurantiacibacter namhicola]ANU08702.1 DNA adenine methyltransferase YhdJ [Paraurantiacibacter namhicola]